MARKKKEPVEDFLPLSIEDQKFCVQFAHRDDVHRAARKCGISVDAANEMLKRSEIQDEIAVLKAEKQDKMSFSQEKIQGALAIIAFANLGDFMKWNTTTSELIDSELIDPDLKLAISRVVQKPISDYEGGLLGYENSVQLKDSLKALELLGQTLNMWDGNGSGKRDTESAKERLFKALEKLGIKSPTKE